MKKRLTLVILGFLLIVLNHAPIAHASSNYVNRVSHFDVVNGAVSLDGYSYVKGVAIPNQGDIIQKLKFVDTQTGKQVLTFQISNFYSTAVTKDPNHGNNQVNYDWAKFKDVIDISSLPTGEYYIKLYTNAKGNAYDEIITFHSSITGFSFVNQQKQFNFVREGQTLKLKVTIDEASMLDPHVKRISKFSVDNGLLVYDGYSYIKGVHIPNQSDIIQKLKFVDTETLKQVKTYQLNNYYSIAASKDPNHGNNVINYDWAKFKGTLDISDLDYGEYYIKIYTNAKGNKYDEIINFHSSIMDFSFETNGKKFSFTRENSTLKVTVEKQVQGPIFTGNSIVNRAVNELGWCRRLGYEKAFLGPYGCETGPDGEDVSVNAMNGTNGADISINIYNSSGDGVVYGVETIIRWVFPTTGQQIINKLHDANFYGGTFENMDGRKITIELTSYGIGIRIYPKY